MEDDSSQEKKIDEFKRGATDPYLLLFELEEKLISEYNEILRQKESFWHKKSKVKWLVKGEQNTKFFHTTVIIRKRNKVIVRLKNHLDDWIDDQNQLQYSLGTFMLYYTRQSQLNI